MQTTLKTSVTFEGVGLHTGSVVRLVVRPAVADLGILFHRVDLGSAKGFIAARWHNVEQTALCTRILNEEGHSVSTIEHLMAAFAGCGIHNALIEIDGPEVPILDGSAEPFVRAFLAAGIQVLDAPLRAIEVLRDVRVEHNGAWARLSPASSLQIDFTIDFSDEAIGHQEKFLALSNDAFLRELSDSRTFCRLADVEAMRGKGLALGGTFDNAVVVDGARILTPGGLRHSDEPVRHKMLDALGDLYTAGAPIVGRYTGFKAGHALTNKLLRALHADRSAWRRVTCGAPLQRRLPGHGLTASDLSHVA